MAKSLVVVESPAKAKTIQKYLGKDFEVQASKGHVRDLPKTGLGVNIEKDFEPEYTISKDRTAVIKSLRAAAKKAQTVYLATDLDREGEAIAWHIAEALGLEAATTYRVVFNEITAGAIREAFAAPGKLDMNKVNAQQARRILDRLVGYKLSPLLWRKIRKGLSAGRVQSVAVRLLVEREREIEAFKAEEYWRIRATLTPAGVTDEAQRFVADLINYAGKKFRPAQGDEAEAIAAELRAAPYTVAERESKRRLDRPPPPFITSELQQAASIQLRLSSQRTMRLAQELYEGVDLGPGGPVALITYMRTDSHHIAGSALHACREFIGQRFGAGYVPEKPNFFASRASAQQAHEAIRPTDVKLAPENVAAYLSEDHRRLYELIWKRFVASQMKPAEWEVTTLHIRAGQGEFKAVGRTLIYDGHTKITGLRLAEDEQVLPPAAAGGALDLVELKPSQHFTQPPPRYSEASLIKELERLGIGRPSTYASILSTIEERGYAEQIQRRYHATEIAKIVTDRLIAHFPKILSVDFTRHMEEDLDKVETAEMGYVDVLREFYGPFSEALDIAMKPVEMATDLVCDLCGKKMVVRASRRGPFLSCAGYPKCKNAKEPPADLVEKFRAMAQNEPSMAKVMAQDTGRLCPTCGGKLMERVGRFGMFVGCEKYPDCKFIEKKKKEPPKGDLVAETCVACGKQLIKAKSRKGLTFFACSATDECGAMYPADEAGQPKELPPCPECQKPMKLRMSRGEPFLGCSTYPECRGTISLGPRGGKRGGARRGGGAARKMLKTEIPCDKCGKKMVVRMSRRGPFLACPGYPKCKNAKDATPELVEQFNAMMAEATAASEAAGAEGAAEASAPAAEASAAAEAAPEKVSKRRHPKP